MCALYVIVHMVLMVLCANCDVNLKDDEITLLPPIFHIDNDYEKCKTEGKLFCKVSIVLKPENWKNVSSYWKIIQESINNKITYNHNELFHAICANDTCPNMEVKHKYDHLKEMLSNCYSRKYERMGLTANVTNFNCGSHNNEYKPGFVDFIWLFIVAAYISYVILATIWDFQIRCENKYKRFKNFEEVYVAPFSVINNWQRLKKENNSPDFQKLKCIQGIRFYNMLLIIFCHTYSSFIGGYVLNTTYIEEIPENPMKLGMRNLFVFLVQTFFLISAFLLSYHVFQVIGHTKVLNKKYIFLMFLNRYIRIIPPVLTMIGVGSTVWIVSLFNGPIKDLYSDLEYQRCRKNWWITLLFINNHYNQHDMCYFITWYLAADTQLYVLSLIVLSAIWKFKRKTTLILAICVITGILIPTTISYIYNLDIIYRITPENTKNNKFRSFSFNAIYSSTYANMATYMVGLCLGYTYFKMKNHNMCTNLLYKIFWWTTFFGLPTMVVVICSDFYTRFYSAILSGVLKPLYALGIGIGILGMSQKNGGPVRAICEWKPAICLGNFTYSTYVVHYGIVFYRTATAKQPLYISDYVLVTSFISDAVLSFICGFLMHILIEMPALQLQNMLIPQVRKQRTSNSSYKKE